MGRRSPGRWWARTSGQGERYRRGGRGGTGGGQGG
jgi:hypothetical protein